MDLDLEAPGLHSKLTVRPTGGKPIKGLVDFIDEFLTIGSVPELRPDDPEGSNLLPVTDLPPGSSGSIHLLAARNAPSSE
jgi:hypothetical protein